VQLLYKLYSKFYFKSWSHRRPWRLSLLNFSQQQKLYRLRVHFDDNGCHWYVITCRLFAWATKFDFGNTDEERKKKKLRTNANKEITGHNLCCATDGTHMDIGRGIEGWWKGTVTETWRGTVTETEGRSSNESWPVSNAQN
jgi:hypothetical protein